jgi:hypothetical protein
MRWVGRSERVCFHHAFVISMHGYEIKSNSSSSSMQLQLLSSDLGNHFNAQYVLMLDLLAKTHQQTSVLGFKSRSQFSPRKHFVYTYTRCRHDSCHRQNACALAPSSPTSNIDTTRYGLSPAHHTQSCEGSALLHPRSSSKASALPV